MLVDVLLNVQDYPFGNFAPVQNPPNEEFTLVWYSRTPYFGVKRTDISNSMKIMSKPKSIHQNQTNRTKTTLYQNEQNNNNNIHHNLANKHPP